jgi:hypothetical protein
VVIRYGICFATPFRVLKFDVSHRFLEILLTPALRIPVKSHCAPIKRLLKKPQTHKHVSIYLFRFPATVRYMSDGSTGRSHASCQPLKPKTSFMEPSHGWVWNILRFDVGWLQVKNRLGQLLVNLATHTNKKQKCVLLVMVCCLWIITGTSLLRSMSFTNYFVLSLVYWMGRKFGNASEDCRLPKWYV